MKKILLVEWFSHPNPDRHDELYQNLIKNINSKLFNTVVVFTQEDINIDANDPEKLGIQYTDVIPLLVASIKELTTRLTTLEQK